MILKNESGCLQQNLLSCSVTRGNALESPGQLRYRIGKNQKRICGLMAWPYLPFAKNGG